MMQAHDQVRPSSRDLAISVAGSSDSAHLVGAVVDLLMALKRVPQGSSAGWPLLMRLMAQGPERPSDLAASVHLDQSTVSRHVAALEADGLVRKVPHPEDRRAYLLEVTDAGAQAAMAGITSRVRQFESAIANWSPADVATFARLLDDFVAGLSAQGRTHP